jgi:ABC-2 type transport system permease protein
MYWRNPAGAAFTFALPLLLLVVFVSIYGNAKITLFNHHARFAQYYIPAIVAFGVIVASYSNVAFSLAIRRARGSLKSLRGTPLPPTIYIVALIVSSIIVAIILTILLVLLGASAYGVQVPHNLALLALVLVVGAFTFGALGAALSTFIPNEQSAAVMVNFTLLPLAFVSGVFSPIPNASILSRISIYLPIREMVVQMQSLFTSSVNSISPGYLAGILAWGVFGVGVFIIRFQWNP